MYKTVTAITIIAACSSAHAVVLAKNDNSAVVPSIKRDASNAAVTAPFHSCLNAENNLSFNDCLQQAGLPTHPTDLRRNVQDSNAPSAPFHTCLNADNDLTFHDCLDVAGLSTKPLSIQQRDVMGMIQNTLPSMTWAGDVFGGQEVCYSNVTDQNSWVAVADVKSALATACNTVIPKALKLMAPQDTTLIGSWKGAAAAYAVKKLVPIQVTLAITGIQKITGGKAVEMVQDACKAAQDHLTGDDSCLTQRDKALTANGGQISWGINADTVIQYIFELGDA